MNLPPNRSTLVTGWRKKKLMPLACENRHPTFSGSTWIFIAVGKWLATITWWLIPLSNWVITPVINL